MDDQTWRHRSSEAAKSAVRGVLHRLDLNVTRDPYPSRVARTLRTYDLTTVLDVGANVGQYARGLRRSGFTGDIISCEPLPHAYEILSRHSRADSKWEVVPTAVGAVLGEAIIRVSANSYSSSLRPMTNAHLLAAPSSRIIGQMTVPVTTVVRLIDQFKLAPERTLLKVDTQGFESDVLDGAGASLSQFSAVQLEMSLVELYDGQILYDDLMTRMRSLGFVVYSFDAGISSEEGRLLQCDCLFVKSF